MRFTRTSEQDAMAEAVHDLLAAADVPGLARAWPTGDTAGWWSVWRKLADMGVTGVAVPESRGGSGFGAVELAVCLEELGYAGLPGPIVETVASVPRLLRGTEAGDTWLPRIADGAALATLSCTTLVPLALDADRANVRFRCDGESAEFAAEPSSGPRHSFDPTRRLFGLDHGERVDGADVRGARTQGTLGCAAQLLGIARRLLDLSVRYVGERRQFGRPVGEFQAVKHHLANVRIQLDFARPIVNGACLSWQAGAAHAERDVAAAKLVSGDAAHTAARTALQVHGAIGYTTEHDLHLWSTKATALRSAWGTPSWHRRTIAEELAMDSTVHIGQN